MMLKKHSKKLKYNNIKYNNIKYIKYIFLFD